MKATKWADNRSSELRKQIEWYIKDGVDTKAAVEMVLEGSTIGSGYKAQIRSEYEQSSTSARQIGGQSEVRGQGPSVPGKRETRRQTTEN